MAETAVFISISNILKAVKMLRVLPKEVAEARDELENFQYFIRDADKEAESEKDNNRQNSIRTRLMSLREEAFRMEDVIDDYWIFAENRPEEDPQCAALISKTVEIIKNHILRLQIAYRIQDVKTLVRARRDEFERHFPRGSTSDGSRGNENSTWNKLRMDPFFIKEDEVVGFEDHIQTLEKLLKEGREERTVISILGMAGVGKTTLSKQVYQRVHTDFDYHALITVPQSYTVEWLLRDMTKKLCKGRKEDPPRDVETMNQMSLIEEVRNRLCKKSYVILFDDVCNERFWDDIENALIDDKKRSRILITTQNEKVVEFCRGALFFQVYNLEPLTKEKSLELLFKKAHVGNKYQKDYEEVGLAIVKNCGRLPLAIVVIGSLLFRKCKSRSEWRPFIRQNLTSELQSNSELQKILGLSYEDLPQNLRSCLLYFGMYPERYDVKCGRLIRHWIAEGFVNHGCGGNLEEVGRQQLRELIDRSLVQVASFTTDGKAKACRVHDSIHQMIRGKVKNTGFCHYIYKRGQFESSGIIRRLTMATRSNGLSGSMEKAQYVRSILIFTAEVTSEDFTRRLLAKYMRLKVLDFEYCPLYDVPENLGNLIHLKYLSFRGTSIRGLPKSISKLQNLETLDIRETGEVELPDEITKLRKLRCLLGNPISFNATGVSLRSLTSLEKLLVLKIDPRGVVIDQLENLTQLRVLKLSDFRGHHDSYNLSRAINNLQLLERLDISEQDPSDVIDLYFTSFSFKPRKLHLCGKLNDEFPIWIRRLENLVKLSLVYSMLTEIPLKALGMLPKLLTLSFGKCSSEEETLKFEEGGFGELKELEFADLYKLRSISIEIGALQSLEKLKITNISQLNAVPAGIEHLKKLQVLDILFMPENFLQRIDPNGGEEHSRIEHVPHVTKHPASQEEFQARSSQIRSETAFVGTSTCTLLDPTEEERLRNQCYIQQTQASSSQ